MKHKSNYTEETEAACEENRTPVPEKRTSRPPGEPITKAIILDVDGVIFRGQFFLHLVRKAGLKAFAGALYNAFKFERGKFSLNQLLTQSYSRLKGLREELLQTTFDRMPRAKNVREAISQLKERGYHVVLLSSGVPAHLVKRLALEIGADQGEGIRVDTKDGVLTGTIGDSLTHNEGKVSFVEEWLKERGLTWNQLVVVGDDDNNLGLMTRAATSIGIRASRKIRRNADYLTDGDDLLKIVPAVFEGKPVPLKPKPAIELRRRLVHITAFAWPFLALYHYPLAVSALGSATLLYSFSEYFRLNGMSFPLFGQVTRSAIRQAEQRKFATAPIALSTGVLLCLPFPEPIPFLAVGIVAFSDSAAGMVGQFFGRHKLPYNPKKTYEGTLTSFGVSLVLVLAITSFCLPHAILTALFASAVESLPLGEWDNLVLPLCVALLCLPFCT